MLVGGLKIIVPPGINVVSNVKAILGSAENDSQRKMNPDAPTLVIEGKVILGEVTIVAQK
jgi:hypothetical protein